MTHLQDSLLAQSCKRKLILLVGGGEAGGYSHLNVIAFCGGNGGHCVTQAAEKLQEIRPVKCVQRKTKGCGRVRWQ